MRVYFGLNRFTNKATPITDYSEEQLRAFINSWSAENNKGHNGVSTEDFMDQARIILSLKEQGCL